MRSTFVVFSMLSIASVSGLAVNAWSNQQLTSVVLKRSSLLHRMSAVPGESCTGEQVTVVGATGYIGKAVVRECIRRGYSTKAVVRDSFKAAEESKFEGADIIEADVCDTTSLTQSAAFKPGHVDIVISCLASRSGSKSDSFAIDYQATKNCLDAARNAGARHFVMLSAFCVKSAERNDPYALQFQYAKKDMEEALREQTDLTYTIVRPTAFFKSVSGQLEVVNGGGPFVYFDLGDGKCATCNPISEPDLAAALVDTIADSSKENALWNLGGPDDGLSMRQQGELVADVLGKPSKLFGVPIGIFDVIINTLQFLADTFKSQQLEDAAEFGRIGRYYALEDMLTTDPAEKYGRTTLREHYERIAEEGQEYDPYTSMCVFASSWQMLRTGDICADGLRLHSFGSKEASESYRQKISK